jgi:3-hydroxyisobutyrate dehydrogenase-like beta-hydroxyacid dehydrogenase
VSTRCGFIGLGIMGKALAGNLAPKGLSVLVYDLVEESIREVEKTGAQAAGGPAEVGAGADVIGICVPADSHVRDVLTGPDGVFAHASRGSVVCVHSTVHPNTVEEMSKAGAEYGVDVLEVPVAGGPVRAAEGNAFYMVAGDERAFEKARPYLDAAANRVLYAGELGNASKLKLAVNVLTNLSFAAALEACELAKAMGLTQELFEEAGQETTMLNPLLLQYLGTKKMPEDALRSEQMQTFMRGRMEIAQKDLSLALEMALASGISMPVTGLVTQNAARVYGVRDDGLR